MANDAWPGGAANHNPEQGEGDWATRQAAAYRAYLEWMPIRETAGSGIHLYRGFRFGTLADLIMLDTRGLRDRQAGDRRSRRWPIRRARSSAPRRRHGCSTSCARRSRRAPRGGCLASRCCFRASRRPGCRS